MNRMVFISLLGWLVEIWIKRWFILSEMEMFDFFGLVYRKRFKVQGDWNVRLDLLFKIYFLNCEGLEIYFLLVF